MPAIDRSMDFGAKSRNAKIALHWLPIFINLGPGELDCPTGILILLAQLYGLFFPLIRHLAHLDISLFTIGITLFVCGNVQTPLNPEA